MATLVIDPITGKLVLEKSIPGKEKQKQSQEQNKQDLVKAGIDETDIELEAEDNNEISGATAFAAGLASGGLIKVG